MSHSARNSGRHATHRLCRKRSRFAGQRGIAMLLVIISLMMATILTTSYLASRDNSAAIGANVASAAAARWVADSGLEFGIAVLQTESNWRTTHVGGRMASGLALAGGTVNIDMIDMKTGLAPGSNTEYLRLTATGTVNGVDQTSVAECHVPTTTSPQMDVDLSEFAVFATSRLDIEGTATVARWPMSPLTTLGRRVQVGTQATGASSIAMTDDGASIDTTVYHGPGASAMLVAVAAGQTPEKVGFLDTIPMPASPSTGVIAPLLISLAPDLNQSSGNAVTNVTTRWKNVTLSNSAIRMLRGNITAVTDENLLITTGAKLIIDGQVKLVVFGDADLDAGSIELRPGARLTMFVRGSGNGLELRDGFIGELRSTATRDATGKAAYMDPERIQIFSVAGAPSAPQWEIRDNSVIKASIYAPDAERVRIRDTSALYGRIASREVRVSGTSAVFYDPALDSRAGFTEPTSALWDNTQHIKDPVKNLTSLDSALLQSVADTVGSIVKSIGGLFTPTSGGGPGPGSVAPGDPTPRTVQVETRYLTFGSALDSWE